MTPDPNTRRWRKSSRSSGQNGECIELTHAGMVRDSKTRPASLSKSTYTTFWPP
jgi:hypothetical protein